MVLVTAGENSVRILLTPRAKLPGWDGTAPPPPPLASCYIVAGVGVCVKKVSAAPRKVKEPTLHHSAALPGENRPTRAPLESYRGSACRRQLFFRKHARLGNFLEIPRFNKFTEIIHFGIFWAKNRGPPIHVYFVLQTK